MVNRMKKAGLCIVFVLVMALSIWGPELITRYGDQKILNRIETSPIEEENEGYRYTLEIGEKLYIFSMALKESSFPESEQSAAIRNNFTQAKSFPENSTYVSSSIGNAQTQIPKKEAIETCNQSLESLKEAGLLPEEVKPLEEETYEATLCSAIDVLEPRNNVAVWQIGLAAGKQNTDKKNRILDLYMDADTGLVYAFYVRTTEDWEELDPDEMAQSYCSYLGLSNLEPCQTEDPLKETATSYRQYLYEGSNDKNVTVTIGFYEGIRELFLKVS